jgi:glycine cleavage system H protein
MSNGLDAMPDHLTFFMGKFPAELPADLQYAPKNHMWCRRCCEGERTICRFGFTSYAVRLMQDVYFLDWICSPGDRVHYLQHLGHIETSKAESDLYAPLAGTVLRFNQELLKDPSAINVDKYGAGWLFEMEGDTTGLVGVAEYHQYLADHWEHTQRVIKGKINMD